MIPKRYEFIMDFDKNTYTINDSGNVESITSIALIKTIPNVRYWLAESIDTPFLSADSDYYVIFDGEKLELEKFGTFIDLVAYLLL